MIPSARCPRLTRRGWPGNRQGASFRAARRCSAARDHSSPPLPAPATAASSPVG